VSLTVKDILDGLAQDLLDSSPRGTHVVWPRAQLHRYLSEAFRSIANVAPDIFDQIFTVELASGPMYHTLCDCDALTVSSVLGQSDAGGNVLWQLRARGDGPPYAWFAEPCASSGSPYRLREYSLGPDGLSIRVYPDIPPAETVHLSIRCAHLPRAECDEVPERAWPPSVQWALYRAKMNDAENNPVMLKAADSHLQAYVSLVRPGTPLPKKTEGAEQ
jgi:hypothetical protein